MKYLFVALVLSCGGLKEVPPARDADVPALDAVPACDVAELLVDGVCRRICANHFHCWSDCCVTIDRGEFADRSVCMDESVCWP